MSFPVDHFGTKKFLLIEDSEPMRNVIRGFLRRCGALTVDTASTGEIGAKALTDTRYDVVLCDYNLSDDGRNGQMLLEEARHKGWITPGTVWVMLTGEQQLEKIAVAAEHAPDDYLLKPVTEDALQARLVRLFERKSVTAPVYAAIQARDYAKALALIEQRLPAGKQLPDLKRAKAQVLEMTGDFKRAAEVYDEVLGKVDAAWARLGLARLRLLQGDADGARHRLEDAISKFPRYLDAFDQLARAYDQLGLYAEQIDLLQRALKISPFSAPRHAALGTAALRIDQVDEAKKAFERSIAINEVNPVKLSAPLLGLARIQADAGQVDAALKTLAGLDAAVDAEAARPLALAVELRAHVKAGNESAAELVAGQLASAGLSERSPLPVETTLLVAEALLATGRKEQGVALMQSLTRNHCDEQSVADRAQRVFDACGMGAAGRELLSVARQQAVDAMNEGVQLLTKGDLAAALVSMRRARELLPQNSRAQLNLAFVIVTLLESDWDDGLADEARDALAAAEAIGPGNARRTELQKRLDKLQAA